MLLPQSGRKKENMRGGMGSQVVCVLRDSGIFEPGSSKHLAKADARAEGARTWAEIGAKTAIYSYRTAETYRDVWRQAAIFSKENNGLKDIEKLSAADIKSYLARRVAEGVSSATFQKECAALGKFGNALNLLAEKRETGREYDFRPAIREVAATAKGLERADPHRAYTNPKGLIAELKNPDHWLAAEIQLKGGARINEVSKIKSGQLKGNGRVEIKGKGGKIREIKIPEKIYAELKTSIEKNGEFNIDKNAYGRDLRQAADLSGQAASGSHGLRWNFAQARMSEIQQGGKSYEQALVAVSHEMGHERADITLHYLR